MRLFAGIRTRPAVAGMVASLSAFLVGCPRRRGFRELPPPVNESEPTAPRGRQLARASGPTGGRLASPTRPLPFGEATSPSATRPRDMRPPGPTRPRATTACLATSSAVPSYLNCD